MLPGIAGGDAGRERGNAGVEYERDRRQRAHRDRARQCQRPVAAAVHADREQHRDTAHHDAARDDRGDGPARVEIDRGRDDKVSGPHRGKRQHGQPDAAARGRGRLIEVMDQHEAADGAHHPQQGPCRCQCSQRVGIQRHLLDDRQQGGGTGERHDHEIDGTQRMIARPITSDQREHEAEPGDVAHAGGDPRRDVARVDPGDCERPQAGRRQCDHERGMRPMPAGLPQLRQRQRAEQQRRERVAPQHQRRDHAMTRAAIIARRPATARRAMSATGSTCRGTANSSSRNTGRIRACAGHPRSTRRTDN